MSVEGNTRPPKQPPWWLVCVGCLITSLQHASVSQGRICPDNFTCFHTEIEAADQTFYLTQSQYTYPGPTSPSADPLTPGAWQGSHWSANFQVTGMTRPRKNPVASEIRTPNIIIIIIIIIIITFKGAIRDFLQSPHSAANCLQHVRTLKWPGHVQHIERLSRASVMLRATWYEGTAQLLSLTELKSHLLSFILLAEPLNR